MPKIFKCAFCGEGIIGGTYTLYEHTKKCPKRRTVIYNVYLNDDN